MWFSWRVVHWLHRMILSLKVVYIWTEQPKWGLLNQSIILHTVSAKHFLKMPLAFIFFYILSSRQGVRFMHFFFRVLIGYDIYYNFSSSNNIIEKYSKMDNTKRNFNPCFFFSKLNLKLCFQVKSENAASVVFSRKYFILNCVLQLFSER